VAHLDADLDGTFGRGDLDNTDNEHENEGENEGTHRASRRPRIIRLPSLVCM